MISARKRSQRNISRHEYRDLRKHTENQSDNQSGRHVEHRCQYLIYTVYVYLRVFLFDHAAMNKVVYDFDRQPC